MLKLYKHVVTSAGLGISEDGAILKYPGSKSILKVENLPLYLPTKENIATLTTVVNGLVVPQKVLFNPIMENLTNVNIKDSVWVLRKYMEVSVIEAVTQIGDTLNRFLLKGGGNPPVGLVDIISQLTTVQGNSKVLVDLNIVKKWNTFMIDNGLKVFRLKTKRGPVVDGTKYIRGVYGVSSTLEDYDAKKMKDEGYTAKEIRYIKMLLEQLLLSINSDTGLLSVTSGKIGSTLQVIMDGYQLVIDPLTELVESLHKFDPELEIVKINYTQKDIKDIPTFNNASMLIPTSGVNASLPKVKEKPRPLTQIINGTNSSPTASKSSGPISLTETLAAARQKMYGQQQPQAPSTLSLYEQMQQGGGMMQQQPQYTAPNPYGNNTPVVNVDLTAMYAPAVTTNTLPFNRSPDHMTSLY